MTPKNASSLKVEEAFGDWQESSRYELIRRLGQGGVGVVYEAFDRVEERSVALKRLSHFTPAALYQFKQEFRTASELHHPNLVRLYELVTDSQGHLFFTMELVRGGDFRRHIRRPSAWPTGLARDQNAVTMADLARPRGEPDAGHDSAGAVFAALATRGQHTPANLDRLRVALLQLVNGVLALHRVGIVHRDLKPSNVIVTSDGRLVVLDFGIATTIGTSNLGASEIVGTPEFMAPEQVLLGPPQPASDWYSVGVMLFDALVGHPPLFGDVREVLATKLVNDMPRPSDLVRGVPPELDELCAALLDRQLERRPSGDDIIRVLGGRGSRGPRPNEVGARTTAELVGRDGHLDVLRQSFARVNQGHSAAVRVAGASGMGKSTLLGRFTEELMRDALATVLWTRVYEEETIPYKALDGLIDGLSRSLLLLEHQGQSIAASANVEALSRLFPILQRVHAIAALGEDKRDDPVRVRQLAVAGLRELLTFATRERPLVLWIDDAQWGDADSVSLLLDLIHRAPPMRVLLLLSHRDAPAEAGHFVHDLVSRWPAAAPMAELRLEPLTAVQVQELFLRELGATDESARFAADAIVHEVAGNPFLVKELAITARLHPLRAHSGSIRESTVSVERLLDERLARVDAHVRRVLELLAVSGRPIRTEILAAAANVLGSLEPSIAILGERRLLRVAQVNGYEVLETCHDRIRETVLEYLSPELLREHHASLARALVQASVLDADALVRHWSGAGEAAHAGEAAIQAGQRSAAKLAFKRSEAFYRLALEKLPHESVEVMRTRRRLAQVLEWDGRGAEAARVYAEAAEQTLGIERSELESAAAVQLVYSGQVAAGVALLRRSLESLGLRAPRTTGAALFWLVWHRLLLRLVVPKYGTRAASDVEPLSRARVEALYNSAFGMVFIDPILGESMQSQHILTALRQGDDLQRARALALEASHRARESGPKAESQAEALFETADGLAEQTGDTSCVAFVRACRGVSQFLRGRWHEAHALLETAYQDVPQHRAGWHTSAWIYNIFSLVNMGSFNEVAQRLPSLLEGAGHRGDRFTFTSLRVAAQTPLLLAMDQPEAAGEQLREAMKGWPSERFLLQSWREFYFSSEVDLYRGRADIALARYRDVEPRLAGSKLFRVQYIRGMTAFLLTRLLLAARGTSGERQRTEAARQISKLERENTAWTRVLVAMARGARAASVGDSPLAVGELTRAVELAERARMMGHAEASRFRLGVVLGEHEGREARHVAEQRLNALGVRDAVKYSAALLPP